MMRYMIVTDEGFVADDWVDSEVCHLSGDAVPEDAISASKGAERVVITFGGTHDGRGFSLARQLRDSGYEGHLRAKGPLVTDQWRHLRGTGFDSLMLTPEQVEKMPASAWRDVQALNLPDYRQRLFGAS